MPLWILSLLLSVPAGANAAGAATASAPDEAAQAGPIAWSTASYVRAVLDAAPEVRQTLEAMASSKAKERSDFAKSFFPALSFSAVLNPAKLAPGDRFTFDDWKIPANDLTLSPGASWNLFNNYRDKLGVRSNRLGRKVAEQNLESSRQSQALTALSAYYGLLLQKKLLEVARQNLKVQHEQYQLTLDRYEHGMKSLSDLLKTETDWRSSELNMETVEAQRRLALFRFNVLIGLEEDTPVALPESLSLGTTEAPRLNEGLRGALMHRPEIRRNLLELENADISYRLARINIGPTLSLDFDFSHPYDAPYGRTAADSGLKAAVYNVTMKLALPGAFNVYSQAQDLMAARADWRSSRQTRESLRRQIREEAYRAHIELLRALRTNEIAMRKEDISRQNLEIVKEQYSQGSADVIRLSEAQSDHVNAQVERVQAFHDTNLNYARYLVAIGEPIWR
ncbi:MAG: TolC family protein [Elusimicrobiota bacterium]